MSQIEEAKRNTVTNDPRPSLHCPYCGLQLIHPQKGRVRCADPATAAKAPSFETVGPPLVLIKYCSHCRSASVYAEHDASPNLVKLAWMRAKRHNAALGRASPD